MLQAGRIVLGVCLTAGLAALGLGVSGSGARALAYVRPVVDGLGEVPALPGSSIGRVEQVTLNGRPMRVLECSSARSPSEVMRHYQEVAAGQVDRKTPFVRADDGRGGGAIHWIDPHGVARAVIVEAHPYQPGRARYRIIIDSSGLTLGAPGRDAQLPAGLRASELGECSVESSVSADDGSGVVVLTAPGDPRGVAGRLLGPLEARGFSCERTALRVYEETSGVLVVPVRHPSGVEGTLTLTPNGDGARTRVCLSLHPGT